MHKRIESLVESMPIIRKLFDGDFCIDVTTTSECVYTFNGVKVKSILELGVIPESKMTGLRAILKEKKTMNFLLSKEVDGADLHITVVPIFNENGEVIGSVGVSRSIEREVKIQNISNELMSSLEETNSNVSEIADSALKFSERLNTIVEKTKQAKNEINESSEVIGLIQNISKQSNLLGLNASIEAARAGEQGKGFSVVASEIRKLAVLSAESSQKISTSLSKMNESTEAIIESIHHLGGIGSNQAAAIEEIAATIEQITSNSQKLVNEIKA